MKDIKYKMKKNRVLRHYGNERKRSGVLTYHTNDFKTTERKCSKTNVNFKNFAKIMDFFVPSAKQE